MYKIIVLHEKPKFVNHTILEPDILVHNHIEDFNLQTCGLIPNEVTDITDEHFQELKENGKVTFTVQKTYTVTINVVNLK